MQSVLVFQESLTALYRDGVCLKGEIDDRALANIGLVYEADALEALDILRVTCLNVRDSDDEICNKSAYLMRMLKRCIVFPCLP